MAKNIAAIQETKLLSLGREDPLEMEMATHSAFLAWRIPWTGCGVPKGLPRWLSSEEPTCQCKTCGFHPWVEKIPWRRTWRPTPVFLPGQPHGQRGARQTVVHRVPKSQTQLRTKIFISISSWDFNMESVLVLTELLYVHGKKKKVHSAGLGIVVTFAPGCVKMLSLVLN